MKRIALVLGVAAFFTLGCSDSQDPVMPEVINLEGDITAELDTSGIEELLANIILSQQNSNLFTYDVHSQTSSASLRDANGEILFDQYRMTMIFSGTITAGNQDIAIKEVYVDFDPLTPGAHYDLAPGAGNRKLDIIPQTLPAGSTANFFVGKRYDVNGAMLEGFTYELHVDAKVDAE